VSLPVGGRNFNLANAYRLFSNHTHLDSWQRPRSAGQKID